MNSSKVITDITGFFCVRMCFERNKYRISYSRGFLIAAIALNRP